MLIRADEIVWRTEEMWWDVSPLFPLIRNPKSHANPHLSLVQYTRPTRPCILYAPTRRAYIDGARAGRRYPRARVGRADRQPVGRRHPGRGPPLPAILHGFGRRVRRDEPAEAQYARGDAQRGVVFARAVREREEGDEEGPAGGDRRGGGG